jgi:fructose-1,6-bisphosphatase/sedoheptulose 1,7-bisphosphatase-like protein
MRLTKKQRKDNMFRQKVALMVLATILSLTFICGQVFAGQASPGASRDTMGPSIVSDPDINPAGRSEQVQGEVAGVVKSGAIGKGQPLIDLLSGEFPLKLELTQERYKDLSQKIRSAIRTAVLKHNTNLAKLGPVDAAIVRTTNHRLISLSYYLSKELYPFMADIRGKEHYLVGFPLDEFPREEKAALAIDFIDWLYVRYSTDTANLRLAQYISHERAPEHITVRNGVPDLSEHKRNIAEIQTPIYGADEVAALGQDIRDFINENLISAKKVPTLKFPGAPDLIFGTVEYNDLMAKIKANLGREVKREELIRIRNIIQSKAPPTFFTDAEKQGLIEVANALTGQIAIKDLNLKIKSPIYKDKPLHNIVIQLVDLKGEKLFRTNRDNFYQEVEIYDEATGTIFIYIPKAFFEEYFPKTNTSAVTQAGLHPLLESIMGLSHQEAALALSFYNSDETLAKAGTVTISDAHMALIEEAKKRAINGDKATIRQLNALLNSDFRFTLSGADIEALKLRGRSIESVDTIRAHSEELARIINGLVRGPIGKFETRVSLKDIEDPDLIAGEMPTQDILDEYSLVTNSTIAAALAVMADGYTGKMTDLTAKAEVSIIKDGTDGLAKREIQVVFNLSGYRITITVSEGGLRDEVEESFMGGDEIGKEGLEVVSIALDVVEGTTAAAKGEAGGTSLAVSAKGKDTLLGNAPDIYASLIAAYVPPEKIAEFEQEPLEPGPYDGEEDINRLRPYVLKQLDRLARANNVTLNQMEVVLLKRDRESVRLAIFKELEQEHGIKVTLIEDGTFNPALKAVLGGKGERLKVFFGTSGAPEAFANVINAKPFHQYGALVSLRVLSNAGLKKASDLSPSYKFNDTEQKLIRELRPDDFQEILNGNKLFTTADVKGEIDGAVTFITNNDVFDLPGIKLSGENTYVVTTLRLREKDGKGYRWIQRNVASIAPLKTEVRPYSATENNNQTSQIAQTRPGVLKEAVEVSDKRSTPNLDSIKAGIGAKVYAFLETPLIASQLTVMQGVITQAAPLTRPIISDEKTSFIFGERATFGQTIVHADNRVEYEPGLGILLPKFTVGGAKIAVIATTDKQRALIAELNASNPSGQQIITVGSVEEAKAALSTARYHYFKVNGDLESAEDDKSVTVFDVTGVVKAIINALGHEFALAEDDIVRLHEAAVRFAQAA